MTHSNHGYTEPYAHIIAFYAPTWKEASTFTSKISWLSAWFTQGNYSHIGLLLDHDHLFHAYWYTRLQNIEDIIAKTSWKRYDLYRITDHTYDHHKAIKIAVSLLGRPYDLRRYFGIVMHNITRIFGKKYNKKHDWKSAYVCHEYVKRVITQAGARAKNADKTYSSPNELLNNFNVEFVCSSSRLTK